MPLRTKIQIGIVFVLAGVAVTWGARFRAQSWLQFCVCLAAILLSSGFKVALPRGDGSMSLNFPFILLAILQLSPLQAMLLAAMSVAAQCRIRVTKVFTLVQIAFNIANAMVATALASVTYTTFFGFHVGEAPALAIAAVTFFFASTGAVAAVLASSKGENPFLIWKKEFPWYLPFYIVGAILAATSNLIRLKFGWATAILLIPLVYTVYRAYTAQMARLKEREQHLEETEALQMRTIEGLAMAIEAKDQNTHDHLFRVRKYVEGVGGALHLEKPEMQALLIAAFLHDIGKLAVPEHIINKPGKLTPEEFEKMKIHPVVGADILQRVRFPYPVVPIVRSHHEWWNGGGYPDGLKGEEIPIGARILSAVDCFDALASDRPYRKALSPKAALAMVKSLSGTQFDPAIVAIMEQLYDQVEDEMQVSTNSKAFVPLNTDIEVWRGIAPGNGFQADSNGANTLTSAPQQARIKPINRNSERNNPETALLNLVATARHEAQALFDISQSLDGSLSLNEILSVMSSRLHRVIPFNSCAFYFKAGNQLETQYVDGENAKSFSAEPIPLGEGISGWVAQNGKPLVNGNAAVEANYQRKSGLSRELRSALAIPLFDLQKNVFGVLTLYAAEVDSFSRDHLRILEVMESKLSLAVQNAVEFRSTDSDAEVDSLTNLPNARRLFFQLEKELNYCSLLTTDLAVIVCNLNSLRKVTELRGQAAANRLLSLVSDGFRATCNRHDVVARMSGDEFVFLVRAVNRDNASERLEAIAASVASASRRAGIEVAVTASLGASFFPQDGDKAEDLLALADRRMHEDRQARHDRSAEAMQAIAV